MTPSTKTKSCHQRRKSCKRWPAQLEQAVGQSSGITSSAHLQRVQIMQWEVGQHKILHAGRNKVSTASKLHNTPSSIAAADRNLTLLIDIRSYLDRMLRSLPAETVTAKSEHIGLP
jgi:hypothetical protein